MFANTDSLIMSPGISSDTCGHRLYRQDKYVPTTWPENTHHQHAKLHSRLNASFHKGHLNNDMQNITQCKTELSKKATVKELSKQKTTNA